MPSMSTEELIREIYRKATGEYDDTITFDSEDGETILRVVNEQVDVYYKQTDEYGSRIIWNNNIAPNYTVCDTSGSDVEFYVDWNDIEALTDGFYAAPQLVEADGKSTRYDLVPTNELMDSRHDNINCFAITADGVVFRTAPPAGELQMAVMQRGRHLEGEETDVEAVTGVHPVLWLLQASAAEYVRTDIVRGDQYPNVLAQANDTFRRMLDDQRARTTANTWEWGDSGCDCSW